MKILCINKSYIPIRLCTKFSAIGKMYCNMAEAIQIKDNQYFSYNFEDWMKKSLINDWPEDTEWIHCTTQRIAIPRIIRYTKYDRIPKVTFHLSRKAIYERDHYTCYLCGEKFSESHLTWDHVVPLSRGGKSEWDNLVTCCQQCNWNKGNKLLNEVNLKPKFMPYKPVLSNIQKLKSSITHHYDEWSYFGI